MDIDIKDKLIKLLNSDVIEVFQLGVLLLRDNVKKEEFLQFMVRYSLFKSRASLDVLKTKRDISFLDTNHINFIKYLDVNNKISHRLVAGVHRNTLRGFLNLIINNIYNDNS